MDIKLRGGFGVREGVLAKAGDVVETHAHNFDHITYCRAPMRYEQLDDAGNVVRSVDKPSGGWVFVKAGVKHRLTALVDNCRYDCIYVHRTPDGEISDEHDGWIGAYE